MIILHKPFLIVGVFRLKKPNRLFNPSIILDWSCCCLCLVKSDLTPSLRDDNDECWVSRPRRRGCWLEAAADGWSRPRLRQMEAAARPREASLFTPATHKILLSQNRNLLQDMAPTVRFLGDICNTRTSRRSAPLVLVPGPSANVSHNPSC